VIDEAVTSGPARVPIVQLPDRRAWTFAERKWPPIEPKAPRFGGKLVYIADGRAMGYAESCLTIVEAYQLGDIVGEPTAGTNGNVNTFTLPGGYQVRWTGTEMRRHDGSRHHGIGVQPTVPVSRTIQGVAAGRDELLEKAIEIAAGRR
jgi:C-terminal processing protease CtpA/Prc